MTQPKGAFKDRLKALRTEYRELLPTRIHEIEEAWQAYREGNEAALEEAYRTAHSLAGSGTTFGFSEVSTLASQLENLFKDLGDRDLQDEDDGKVAQFVDRLKLASGEGDNLTADTVPELPQKPARSRRPIVFWLGRDARTVEQLCMQLPIFGFQSRHMNSLEQLQKGMARRTPDILVYDLSPVEETSRDESAFFDYYKSLEPRPPLVTILAQGTDLNTRLDVIRNGADSIFTHPIHLDDFLLDLDQMAPAFDEANYRLLIVDDDEMLAKNSAAILEKAGMEVMVVSDPIKALDLPTTFAPDLMLVDLHMPGCNGIELTRLMRQEARFHDLAVVYLSKEAELGAQLAALEAGAEDFLLKPVKYKYLYHTLACRIRRARRLRQLTHNDTLTNLTRHTDFQLELARRVAHGAKTDAQFVLAMLDLDQFREVNDIHGHHMGDRVLRALALMLRRGFGNRVLTARWHGDRFALLLPQMNEDRAQKLLDRLRQDFARVHHRGYTGTFQVTLSCGLAEFPRFANVGELIQGAEKALDQAKQFGRNKTLSIDPFKPEDKVPHAQPDPNQEPDGDMLYVDDDDLIPLDEEPDGADTVADTPVSTLAQEDSERNGQTIIVVDDDRQVLDVITSYLENQGFTVHGAVTGDEGFKLALEHKPNLILIDLLLFPGIHGFELCKKIKEEPKLEGIKAILMTAVYKDYRYRLEAREAGGDAFIIKPINFDELMENIETLLKQSA